MELALPPEWIADLPTDRPLTADDFLRLPEGPPYFELLGGEIVVSASANRPHARIARNLFKMLDPVCPPGLEVFPCEVDWVVDEHNVVEPDLIVAARIEGTEPLREPPLLCLEVLSPSTRRRDITYKREIYERAGVLAYWIVDVKGPSFTALELDAGTGRYIEAATIVAQGTFETTVPYPVTIDVGRLTD